MAKIYKLQYNYKNRTEILEGTVQQLAKYFSYTLEVGNSYKDTIKTADEIKTYKSFMSNLQKASDIEYGSCYEQPYYQDVTDSWTGETTKL